MDNCRYPKKAYNMMIALQRQNYSTWACNVRNVLYRFGFGIVWETQYVGNVKIFISVFKQRLIDCFTQDWTASLESHEFYYVYSCFKRDLVPGDYLHQVLNIGIRKVFTRFRIGMSPLKSHFLKYRTEEGESDCPFCIATEETEFHFLLCCPMYNELRAELIPQKYGKQKQDNREKSSPFCVQSSF